MPEVEPVLRLAPLSIPWGGTISVWGRSACALHGLRDHGEDTKRRTAAMMLSRLGRDTSPHLDRGQIGEGRRAPWGCVAGAPYWGTASPPPPPPGLTILLLMPVMHPTARSLATRRPPR